MAFTGEELNEMSTLEEIRNVFAKLLKVNIFHGDADEVLEDGIIWVESATTTNLPTGATQGFLFTRTAKVNGKYAVIQEFNGTDGTEGLSQVRYRCATCNTFFDWA